MEFKLGVVEELDGCIGNDVNEGSGKLADVIISATGTNAALVMPSTLPEHVVRAKKSTKADIAEDGNSELTMREVLVKVYGLWRFIASPDVVTHRPPTGYWLVIEYAVNTTDAYVCVLGYGVSVVVLGSIDRDYHIAGFTNFVTIVDGLDLRVVERDDRVNRSFVAAAM